MRLYLMRHGAPHSAQVDPDRRLTAEGMNEVLKVAAFLRTLEVDVSAIWHSGKARALQTAELLAPTLNPRDGVMHREGLRPDDPIGPIKDLLRQTTEDVVIVGHLPFLNRLALALVGGNGVPGVIDFVPGGIGCLERDDDGRWTLLWLITPALLK